VRTCVANGVGWARRQGRGPLRTCRHARTGSGIGRGDGALSILRVILVLTLHLLYWYKSTNAPPPPIPNQDVSPFSGIFFIDRNKCIKIPIIMLRTRRGCAPRVECPQISHVFLTLSLAIYISYLHILLGEPLPKCRNLSTTTTTPPHTPTTSSLSTHHNPHTPRKRHVARIARPR
jgi:hypothetical protein